MPSLRQKPDGRWFIDYREDGQRKREIIQHDGQPVRDSVIAQAFYDAWLEAREAAPAVERDSGPRIARILDYYRDVHLPAYNAAPASHAAAQTHAEAFLQFCRREHIGRAQQLNTEVLARWSAGLQKTRGARTTKNYLATIRTAINCAVEAGLLDRSPVRKWTVPRVDPVDKSPLTIDELRNVLDIFHDRPIVQWIGLTGNRPSDARTLRFRDVDIPSRTVDRGSKKPRDLRKYEISDAAALLVAREAQRDHRPEDIVFRNSHGNPWSADGLLNSFKDRLARAEYPRALTLKDLRDSFASIMANDIGVPLPTLQVLMGHTDIKTTMQYVRARGARDYLTAWDQARTRENPQ